MYGYRGTKEPAPSFDTYLAGMFAEDELFTYRHVPENRRAVYAKLKLRK